MSVAEIEVDQTPDAAETCPRCHSTESWGQSSWCPRCNYYPVVDKGAIPGTSWADDLPEIEQEVDDNRGALESIPAWFWGMLGGATAIAIFSVSIRMTYPEAQGPRGTIALVQLCLGLATMITAHLVAAKLAMATDRRTSFNDVLLSWFSIWHPTISQLPKTYKQIWAVVWGAIATVTAVTIIGGIDYAAPFRTHKAPEIKTPNLIGAVAGAARAGASNKNDMTMEEALGELTGQVEEAAALGSDAGSMEDSLKELGNPTEKLKDTEDDIDANGNLIDAEGNPIPTRNLDCFIYGVVTDVNRIPTSFLFAAKRDGVDQHVAEIKVSDIPHDKFRRIAAKLFKQVTRTSVIPSNREAVWVRPAVTCRLKFVEFDKAGELSGARFEAVVVNQRGVFDGR